MQITGYFLIASVCLSLFYAAYRLIFKKESNFRHMRIYLLGSIALSLLFPLSSFQINTGITLLGKTAGEKLTIETTAPPGLHAVTPVTNNPKSNEYSGIEKTLAGINWTSLALRLYFVIAFILLLRIGIQVIALYIQYVKSDKIRDKGCVLIFHHRFSKTFSFFNWIFVYDHNASQDDMEQIIAHEKIHVNQVHSFDLLAVELLAAVMWFNPLIWMLKNSMQLVHEYLADEGALSTGIDRLRYQALLINQVTEERFICLSSSFNPVCRPGRYSLIKKRMIMMTTSKMNQGTRLRLLALVPIAVSLFLGVAVFNGFFAENARANYPATLSFSQARVDFGTPVSADKGFPADTIKTITITKKVDKNHPMDTMITKHVEIIISDSADSHLKMRHALEHPGDAEYPDQKIIYISHSTDSTGKEIVHRYSRSDDRRESDGRIYENNDSIVTTQIIHDDQDDEIITTTVKLRHRPNRERSKILFVIDGVNSTSADPLSALDPNDIESIHVIKDSEVKKYTNDDFDGVIVVKTKPGKKK